MADRIRVLGRMLWLVLFSALTIGLGNFVLMAVPQARETLLAIEDGSAAEEWARFAVFCGAYLYWAFTAWLVARLMIGRAFPRDIVQPPAGMEAFADLCARWIPRGLGLLATVPLAVTMAAVKPGFGAVMGLLAAAFLAFVILRHRVPWLADPVRRDGRSAYRCFEHMPARARGWLLVLIGVSWGVFMAVWLAPVGTGRGLGAPALLLLALGGWTLFGSIVLTYLPNTRGWWNLHWLPLLALLVASRWDNHPVAAAPKDAAVAEASRDDWRRARPALAAHFKAWMQGHGEGEPVYMVAVAGGASRAAYWSGMVLGQLHDQACARGADFGGNLYMLSSISGGSLGAAAFVSALAASPQRPVTPLLDDLLARDFLAPVVGMMLYPDLVQRLLPVVDALHPADRSRALEDAWVADWREASQGAGRSPAPGWQGPLTQPYLDAPQRRLPSLVLNTVRLEDGQRLLQSNLKFELPDAVDLLQPRFDTRHLTLAGAVHNSARFPYVSPAGRVQLRERGSGDEPDRTPTWGHLGDGGYHEASGAASLADVVEALMQQGLIVRDGQARLMACGDGQTGADCRHPVVLVMIDNQPGAYGPAWQRDLDGRPRAPDAFHLERGWPLAELSDPPLGLVRGWTSNGTRAERRLSRLAGDAPEGYVELRLPLCPAAVQPSMTWHLNRPSRELIKRAAVQGCGGPAAANLADAALRANLERVRRWFAQPAAAPVATRSCAPASAAGGGA